MRCRRAGEGGREHVSKKKMRIKKVMKELVRIVWRRS